MTRSAHALPLWRLSRQIVVVPLVLAVGLAGCGPGKPVDTQPGATAEATTQVSAPDAKPGLALSGGRLVLPAVKGNPGAVYFTLSNGSAQPVTLAAIDVAGAGMTMLHETRQVDGHATMAGMTDPVIGPGQALVLAPGGKHVMVDAIPAGWAAGGSTELTLTFSDGDKLSAPLSLDAPGGE